MQTTVGSFEAKTHFAHLLDRIEKGEEIFITRRGKRVAKLVPIQEQEKKTVLETVLQFQVLAHEMKLGDFNWEKWKQYRDEGRH